MALASAVRKILRSPTAADLLNEHRALTAKVAAHTVETHRLEAQVDAARERRESIAAEKSEAENAKLFAGGDTEGARELMAKIDELDAKLRVQDRIISVTQRELFDREHTNEFSRLQQRAAEARQATFGAIRDSLLEQITPEIIDLVCRAQMASAQAGDGLNFGPFADRYLRNRRSRITDHDLEARVAFAAELLAEVDA